ncbi:MAG: hypothetical protein HC834_05290 [Rhodospirillales bacterium]|nr:hypothetical protein [Rhodospirillales bacterium]
MNDHKFSVGQTVRFSPRSKSRSNAPEDYKVVRLLPAEHNDQQYRVKSTSDGHERVVKESQLS